MPRIKGRFSNKSVSGKRSKVIKFRVSEATKNTIKKAAKITGLSVSDLIHIAIKKNLVTLQPLPGITQKQINDIWHDIST